MVRCSIDDISFSVHVMPISESIGLPPASLSQLVTEVFNPLLQIIPFLALLFDMVGLGLAFLLFQVALPGKPGEFILKVCRLLQNNLAQVLQENLFALLKVTTDLGAFQRTRD